MPTLAQDTRPQIRPQPGPQTQFLQCDADVVIYGGSAGGGKGLRPDEPVLTPFGWRAIGALKVGDALCATDGTVTRVIGVYHRGAQPLYRLTFSDGAEIECDADHIWLAWPVRRCRKIKNRKVTGQDSARKWTTAQIAEHYQAGKENLKIPCLEAPATFNVAGTLIGKSHYQRRTIPPYVLGALLGDGHLGVSGITIATEDREIIDAVGAGLGVSLPCYESEGKTNSYRVPNAAIMDDLSRMGLVGKLSNEKFIPRIYLFGGEEERWALLRGLMDTDGWAEKDRAIYYSTVSERLADDVTHLARSLGGVVSRSEKQPHYTHNGERRAGQRAYALRIKLPDAERAFGLERKKRLCRGKTHQSMGRTLVSIEPAGRGETVCIAVAHPNSLFITSHFLVTHNTWSLLLEPMYDIDNPLFGCVTFRRTTKQVTNEGGLWDEAGDIYPTIGGKPNQNDLSFKFPSGAKHTFAHMEHEKNRLDWQGSQIPLIQFDELTHFSWRQFIYMLSRNRSMSGVKGRIRATCNPDPDHWVRRFIDWWIGEDGFAIPERSGVIRWFIIVNDEVKWGDSRKELTDAYPGSLPKSFTFIRSSVYDNKILLEADPGYLANLQAMPRVERAQLLDGNWNVRASAGMYFKRGDFKIVDAAPVAVRSVRAWDQAGTYADMEDPDDPDWTAGVKMSIGADGYFYIEHVDRFREDPPKVDSKIRAQAEADGKLTTVRLAQDPGSAGKSLVISQTKMLAGYPVNSKPVTGDKEIRAKPLAAQVQAGNVRLVRGGWNDAFLNELESFPEGAKDDQVDAAADAFDELTGQGTMIFKTPIESMLCNPFEIPRHWPRMYALEADWEQTAVLWAAWDKTIDCLYLYTSDLRPRGEPSVLASAVRARGDWITGVMNPRGRKRTKEDGERLIEEYRSEGLILTGTENAPETGIQTIEERASTGRIKVFRTMDDFQAQWRLYRRDESGKIDNRYDLLMDTLRGVVASYRHIATTRHTDTDNFGVGIAGDPTIGY